MKYDNFIKFNKQYELEKIAENTEKTNNAISAKQYELKDTYQSQKSSYIDLGEIYATIVYTGYQQLCGAGAIIGFILGCIFNSIAAGPIGGLVAGLCIMGIYRPVFGTLLFPIVILIVGIIKACQAKKDKALEKRLTAEYYEYYNKITEQTEAENNEILKNIPLYEKEYIAELQQKSIALANSDLAKEIISWISNFYCKLVKVENRESHVQFLEIPLKFSVYKEKIACEGLGYYDFETHRCENISDSLTQEALARAIASQVQLSLTMQLEKDPSGTSYKVDINYEYESSNVITAVLTYKATNGNYEEIKKW